MPLRRCAFVPGAQTSLTLRCSLLRGATTWCHLVETGGRSPVGTGAAIPGAESSRAPKGNRGPNAAFSLLHPRDPSWPVPFHPTPTPFHARAARAFVFPKTGSSPDSLTRSKTCLRRNTGRAGEDCYSRLGTPTKTSARAENWKGRPRAQGPRLRPLGGLAGRPRRHPAA